MLAQSNIACVQVGEYCFDPQIGMYKKDKDPYAPINPTYKLKLENKELGNSELSKRSLIKCEEGNFFDMFCGQAKAVKKRPVAKLEVWIDTSSSMRRYDDEDEQGHCARKNFAERLKSHCANVDFYGFDTSKRYMQHTNSFCLNKGLNDTKKIISWIEDSHAKRLIIITDIEEYTAELANYIYSIGGMYKGADVGNSLPSNQLVNYVDEVVKLCSN